MESVLHLGMVREDWILPAAKRESRAFSLRGTERCLAVILFLSI